MLARAAASNGRTPPRPHFRYRRGNRELSAVDAARRRHHGDVGQRVPPWNRAPCSQRFSRSYNQQSLKFTVDRFFADLTTSRCSDIKGRKYFRSQTTLEQRMIANATYSPKFSSRARAGSPVSWQLRGPRASAALRNLQQGDFAVPSPIRCKFCW